MNSIQILPSIVSDKIAAGEVAERPSAVVKELVENSVDAGADHITVEIKKGGIEYIRVEDNGCGIPPEQAEIAFLRHATSKLRNIDELYEIHTMGFRGEALASICAVAEVELITKTKGADEGLYLRMQHAKPTEKQSMPCGDGTTMIVKNLFSNVPARMKFLKKDSTEAGYVADLLGRIALSRPDIAFKYICDDKEIFSTNGDGNLKNAVLRIYGLDHARAVIEVDYTEENIHVKGVVGKPELARGNRTRQTLFVNGRYVKNHVAAKVVEEAYRNSIMVGRFPFFVLDIRLAPELVDVNVHPAKTEVKFANEKQIYDVCYHAVRNAIYSNDETQNEKTEKPSSNAGHRLNRAVFEPREAENTVRTTPGIVKEYMKNTIPTGRSEVLGGVKKSSFLAENKEDNIFDSFENKGVKSDFALYGEPQNGGAAQIKMEQPCDDGDDGEKSFSIVGQVFDTYVLYRSGDELFMIDQHAAHERFRFESLKKSYSNREKFSQMLMSPAVLSLGFAEKQTVKDNLTEFRNLGFELDDFGGTSIIVHGAPIVADEKEIHDLVLELAEAMHERRKHPVADFEERALDMIACKYAIKANKKLTYEEMRDLIKKTDAMEKDGIKTCPHGRPIKISFSKKDIEKMFKRRI